MIESVRRAVVDKLKAAYFRLAYMQQALSTLERNDQLLKRLGADRRIAWGRAISRKS
jgi:hypothetical protein